LTHRGESTNLILSTQTQGTDIMQIHVKAKNLLTGESQLVTVDSWNWKDRAKESCAVQWGICFDSVKVELV